MSCIFHTTTSNNVVLCCARTKDVFPPHQPVLECGFHKTWFNVKYAMTTTVIACGLFIGGFMTLTRPPAYYELHNLRNLETLDTNKFRMASLDRDTGTWNDFRAVICTTFALPPELYEHRRIRLLKYRRDLVNNCWDISDRKAGIIFEQ